MSDVDLFKKKSRCVFHVFENIGAKNSSVFIICKVTYRNTLCFKRVINQFLILSCLLLFRQRFSPYPPKDVVILVPWVPEIIVLRVAGIFRVGQRPKIRAARQKLFSRVALWMKTWQKPEIAEEVSGKQGIILVFSEIAGPTFPWFFFSLGFTLNEFFGGTFSLTWFFFVSSPPPRPHHFSNSPSLIK